MGAEENKARLQRYYEQVWLKGDFSVEAELVAENVVDHAPLPGTAPGREGHRQMVTMIANAFPDRQFETTHLIAEGDRVVGRWTMRATHRGELMGIPATGRSITMTGIDVTRWENGQLAEVWHVEDVLGMLQQMGVVPAPEGVAAG